MPVGARLSAPRPLPCRALALCVGAVAFFAAAVGLSAQPLPHEARDGIIYIPSREAVHSPSALEEQPPDRLDHALYTEFPEVRAPEAEGERASGGGEYVDRDALREAGFEEYTSIYTHNDNDTPDDRPEVGALEVGTIARNETVPFALLDSESDRYEAVLWRAELSYANLVVHAGGNTMVLDLGALYEYNLAAAGGNAESEGNGRTEGSPFASDTPSFLPAAPVDAELEWFEPLDEFLLTVTARTLISLDDPSLEPAEVRILLRPADDTLEMAGYFIEALDYGNGSRYSARHELLEGNPAALREQVLRRTHLGGSSYRYRLAVGEYQMSRGRFMRSSGSQTVFEERFPHTLKVAEDQAPVYEEPGGDGETVTELPRDTRVRAVEPWDRLDTRDGVDGVWYRVQSGGHEGWMWAPDLAEPE